MIKTYLIRYKSYVVNTTAKSPIKNLSQNTSKK